MNDYKVRISIAGTEISIVDAAYEVDLIDFLSILGGAESMLLKLELNGNEAGREETKKRRLLAHDMRVGLFKYYAKMILQEEESE